MSGPERSDQSELDADLTRAFSRLRDDADQLDAMAALRRTEGSSTTRRSPFLPLVAGAAVIVALVASVVLGGRELSTPVVTGDGQPSVAATVAPTVTPPPIPSSTALMVATVTPTPAVESSQQVAPTPVTPVPTLISRPAETDNDAADPYVPVTPPPEAGSAPTSPPEDGPEPAPSSAPTAEPELVVLTTRGGPFVGIWELASMAGGAPTADSVGARLQIFPGGELNAKAGCWLASGFVKTDSRLRLRVVSESLQLSSSLCSHSDPAPPEILLRIRELELAVLSDGGGLSWEAAPQTGGDGYRTSWRSSTGTVLNGGGPSEPFGDLPLGVAASDVLGDGGASDEVQGDAGASDEVRGDAGASDDIRAFAGPWRLVAVDDAQLARSDLTLHLSTTGDLTLSSACHEYIGRVQTTADDGLAVVAGSYGEVLNQCDDARRAPLPDKLIADVENARAAVVTDGQLRWTVPGGSTLFFERE